MQVLAGVGDADPDRPPAPSTPASGVTGDGRVGGRSSDGGVVGPAGGGVTEGFDVGSGGGDARRWGDRAGAGPDQAGGVLGGGQGGDRGEFGDREQIPAPEPTGGDGVVGATEVAAPVEVVVGEGREDRGDAVGAAADPPPRRPQPGPAGVTVAGSVVGVGMWVVAA